tara:strand:+ start:212 stop:463 length:252 start_codon:yes stop_codon:yes gene_type:complete
MFKILQHLSIFQIVSLFAFVIGIMVIFFVLINVFFWFLFFAISASFILKQYNKFKNRNHHTKKTADDYLVTEYINLTQNDDKP